MDRNEVDGTQLARPSGQTGVARETSSRLLALASVAVLLVVGLVMAEVAVRLVFPYSTPETLRAYSVEYESSPFTRTQFAPSGRLVEVDAEKAWGTKDADTPSESAFYINARGFRGPDFAGEKPEGLTRMFVLGGSSVFDQNVFDESPGDMKSWPNRAQTLLRDRGYSVEVINGGTPSHSTTDALGRLVSEIWLYQPDFVLLYNGWNDIKNFRAREVTPDDPLARLIHTYEADADLYRRYAGFWDRLFSKSQLYNKIRFRYLAATMRVGAEGALPTGTVGSTYGPYGVKQYELNLRGFVDLVRNMGATPILTTQLLRGGGGDVALDEAAALYQLLDAEGIARAYADIERTAREVAREERVPFLDVATSLRDRPDYLSDEVHFSTAGSEAMARLLVDYLVILLDEDDEESR